LDLPEENTYIFVDLEKIDFIIGFQGEEMVFRNYLYWNEIEYKKLLTLLYLVISFVKNKKKYYKLIK